MLEVLITFAVILFAGISVTLGVRRGQRTPQRSCHGEPQADAEEAPAKCQACGAIGSCHETGVGIRS
jgi:hypothetical protein